MLGLTLAQFEALDDLEREHWIAHQQIERERCPQCGNPQEVCRNPESLFEWYPQRTICHATMQLMAANRVYDAKHEGRPYHDGTWKNWSKEFSPDYPFHYRDGVTIWVSGEDLAPDDDFLELPSQLLGRSAAEG